MIDLDYTNDEDGIEEEVNNYYSDTTEEEPEDNKRTVDWILNKLSYLAMLPMAFSCMSFAAKNNYLPDIKWKFILLFFIILICSFFIIKSILSLYKYTITILFFIALGWLGFNTLREKGYGFKALQRDYVNLVMSTLKKGS